MKDKMSSSEFREYMNKGYINQDKKGKLKMDCEFEQKFINDYIHIDIFPLSVNKAWQGRRFKTHAYKEYERTLIALLPEIRLPKEPFKVSFIFGFSNKSADIDNPTKLLFDIMQKKYGFNDSKIYELNIKKTIVPKGQEFIEFKIEFSGK